MMAWSIDTDDFTGRCGEGRFPLMRAINSALDEHGGLRPLGSDKNVVFDINGNRLDRNR